MIQCFYNGNWIDSIKAQVKVFNIIENGKIVLESAKMVGYSYIYSGAETSGGATIGSPSVVESTDYIQIANSWNQSEGSREGSAFITVPIDVTNWNKLILDFVAIAANQYCEFYFGLTTSIVNNYPNSCGHFWYNSLTLIKELDISSLKGNYYLVVFVRGASNRSSYVNIKNIYLK